jgi:hypothetical protein
MKENNSLHYENCIKDIGHLPVELRHGANVRI